MSKYKHFGIEEREKIQEMLWQKASVREISRVLGRNPSSVSREINRNLPPLHRRYTPRLAEERALKYRKHRGREKRLKNERIREYVVTGLKKRWSPEQIAGRIRIDLGETISHEAIYQFIYAQIHRDGYGYLKPGHVDLRIYLRRRRKRRMPKGGRRPQRVLKPKGLSIEERPNIVDQRKRIGDWEGDSIEGANHGPGVNTVVERKAGLIFITKLKDKTSEATAEAMAARFRDVPAKFKKTVTLDNGPENSNWISIESQTNLKCFYAHPYSSWERPCNENANGLIRDYFPKKTDFTKIPNEEIAKVEYALNTRPRKRLGFRTPLEVWSVAIRG